MIKLVVIIDEKNKSLQKRHNYLHDCNVDAKTDFIGVFQSTWKGNDIYSHNWLTNRTSLFMYTSPIPCGHIYNDVFRFFSLAS